MANLLSALTARFRPTQLDADGNAVPRLPKSVKAEQALDLLEQGATLLDVRERHEWRTGHAPRAVHIPLAQVHEQARRISTQRPVVVMCATGSRSRVAAGQLRKAGYRATSLSGGIMAWKSAGGPVRTGR